MKSLEPKPLPRSRGVASGIPAAETADPGVTAAAEVGAEWTWIPPAVAVRSTQGTSARAAIQILPLSEMHLARGLLTLFTLLAHITGHPLRSGATCIHCDYTGTARPGQDRLQNVSGGQQADAR